MPHSTDKTLQSLRIKNKTKPRASFLLPRWDRLVTPSTCSCPLEGTLSTYYSQASAGRPSEQVWEQSPPTMFKLHPGNYDELLNENDTSTFIIYLQVKQINSPSVEKQFSKSPAVDDPWFCTVLLKRYCANSWENLMKREWSITS